MKICMKGGEHIRIQHDSGGGFTVWVSKGQIHIAAKGENEELSTSVSFSDSANEAEAQES